MTASLKVNAALMMYKPPKLTQVDLGYIYEDLLRARELPLNCKIHLEGLFIISM